MATSKTTLPSTEEVATMSTEAVLLFGVYTTLNKLAVKLESSWQVFNEFDVSMGSAAAKAEREEKRAKRPNDENLMMLSRVVSPVVGGERIECASLRRLEGCRKSNLRHESH